jgi:glutaredoxin
MKRAVYYHDGSEASERARHGVVEALDRGQYEVEEVDLRKDPGRVGEARTAGVQSVPALVMEGHAFHIDRGNSIDSVGGGAPPQPPGFMEPAESTTDHDVVLEHIRDPGDE